MGNGGSVLTNESSATSGFAATSSLRVFVTEGISGFNLAHENGLTDLPLPEQAAKENVLIKLFGAKESFNISFPLTQSSSDRSAGTNSAWGGRNFTTNPLTVIEQIDYLNSILITTTSTDEFGFFIVENVAGTDTIRFTRSPKNPNGADGGVYLNINVDYAVGSEKAEVRVTFTVGRVE